jgi:hypothetical protein
VKILVRERRESCVEVVKIEFLLQKVEISVRESCVEVHKFACLTPKHRKGCAPPKGAPAFFKDTYYILHCAKKIKSSFFASQDKSAFSEDE